MFAQRLDALSTKFTKSRKKPVVAKRDWAHVVDVNRELINFGQLVPVMAKEVYQAHLIIRARTLLMAAWCTVRF